MKKITCLLLALVLALGLLAGCTGADAGGEAEEPAAPAEDSGAASEAPAEGEEGEVDISVLSYMGEGSKRTALKMITDAYSEAHPGVTFTIQDLDMGNFMSMLQTRMAAGDAPDLIMGAAMYNTHLIEAGQLMDLTGESFVEKTGADALSASTIDGKVYSLPIDWSIMGVFYNKDMFAEYNLEEPTTYAEFITAIETFVDAGIVPFTRAFKDANNVYCDFSTQWYPILERNQDLEYFQKIQSGEKKFSDFPESREALELFAERLSYPSDDDLGTDASVSLQRFAAGEYPMHIDGSWAVGDIIANNPDGNFGVFATPISDNVEENLMYLCTDDAWMVSSQTQHKDVVFDLLDFMVSNEGLEMWANNAVALTFIPTENEPTLPPLMQDIKAVYDAGNTMNIDKYPYFTGEAYDRFNKNIQLFVSMEDRDVDTFLAQLDSEFENLE